MWQTFQALLGKMTLWCINDLVYVDWLTFNHIVLLTLKMSEWTSETLEYVLYVLVLLFVSDDRWTIVILSVPACHLHLPELPPQSTLRLSSTECNYFPFARSLCHGRRCVFFAGKAVTKVSRMCICTSVFRPSALWHQVQSYSVLLC